MQSLVLKSLVWLVTEMFLTLVGLDNLADYGEFIFRLKDELAIQPQRLEQLICTLETDQPFCRIEARPAFWESA